MAGTGTEIGKTWVAVRTVEELRRRHVVVVARKPAQSFDPGSGPTDAELLGAASGAAPHEICPSRRSYEVAMAPFMAAEVLGRPPFTMNDLVTELAWPPDAEVGVIESVGGVRSPISSEGADTVDLARSVGALLVVLVADAGLGTINAVRLSTAALHGFNVVVFLNRFDADDDLHRRNREWLATNVVAAVYTEIDALADAVVGYAPGGR